MVFGVLYIKTLHMETQFDHLVREVWQGEIGKWLPCAIGQFEDQDDEQCVKQVMFAPQPQWVSMAVTYLIRYIYMDGKEIVHVNTQFGRVASAPWRINRMVQLHKVYSHTKLERLEVFCNGVRLTTLCLLGIPYEDGAYTFKYPITLFGTITNYIVRYITMEGDTITTPRLDFRISNQVDKLEVQHCELVNTQRPIHITVPMTGADVDLSMVIHKCHGFIIELTEPTIHVTSMELRFEDHISKSLTLHSMGDKLLYASILGDPFFMLSSTLVDWMKVPNFSRIGRITLHVQVTKPMDISIRPWNVNILARQGGLVGTYFA